MLSFLAQPYFHIGSVNIMMFDIMLVVGIITVKYTLHKQALLHGLDQKIMLELFLIGLLVGLPLSHVFGTLWSTPYLVLANPMILVHFNAGIDSFGGFLGFALGLLVYIKIKGQKVQPLLAYLDSAAYAMCGGWIIFRLGCAFAHDHPGRPSAGFLSIQYPDWLYGGLSRHNLGLDEAIGTTFIFMILYILDRKPHQDGLICSTLLILYSIMRFFLDFLRATDLVQSDIRYGYFTPAQWGCMLLFILGVSILAKLLRTKQILGFTQTH